MTDLDRHREWNIKASLAFLFLNMTFIALGALWFIRCGSIYQKDDDNAPAGACEGTALGDIKSEECDSGQRVSLCTQNGFKVISDTCLTSSNCVSFNENVKPIIDQKCVSCHISPLAFNQYNVAKEKIGEFIRRIQLSSEDPRRMPKVPNPELSFEEKQAFVTWQADGLKETQQQCAPKGDNKAFLELEDIEGLMLADLALVDSNQRRFTRYLVATHKFNLKDEKSLRLSEQASNLNLNFLVQRSPDLVKVSTVGKNATIFRLDLRSYELDEKDWIVIEQSLDLRIISETDAGKTLRAITGTNIPWVHTENFIDATMGKAKVYYFLTESPRTLFELYDKLGVNNLDQINNFETPWIGIPNSPLSQSSRLMIRFRSVFGAVWQTFDPGRILVNAQENLFNFPLISEANPKGDAFQFQAGELLYVIPNGLMAYFIADFQGNRLDFAAQDIVVDFETPLADKQIDIAVDCARCHGNGFLPAVDQVRAHVIQNASQFDLDDVDKVKQLYRGASANAALFNQDNQKYLASKAKLGVGLETRDPINYLRDIYRFDWDLAELATFLFVPVDEFKQRLAQSAVARQEVGQLLEGGTVSYEQLFTGGSITKIIDDLRLFKEVRNGEN